MPSTTVQVSISRASAFAATSLRVEVTVRGPAGAVVVGAATPDESGRCQLTYDPNEARGLAAKKRPRVRLHVLAGGAPLPVSGGPAVWSLDEPPQAVSLSVGADDGAAAVTEPGTVPDGGPGVSGTVRHTDGSRIAGATVQLAQLGLTGEQVLASATTGSDGGYRLAHNAEASPFVFVRVLREDGAVVAASPPVNGTATARVDVYVRDDRFRGPADFRRVHEAVAPLIEGGDLATLGARSVGFLADGTQVGVVSVDERPAPAPSLDTSSGRATVDGTPLTAAPIDGTTGSGF